MRGICSAAFGFLTLSVVPATLSAKGDIVKITIRSADLAAPVEIYPNIGEFNVWAGVGTSRDGAPQTRGFIVEWPKGVVTELPDGLQHYEVSFYAGCRKGEVGCNTTEPVLAYVVTYAYDPAMDQGYVYLPGKGDEFYGLNTRSIFRGGLEGHWFYATSDWEKYARPRIAKAKVTRPGH